MLSPLTVADTVRNTLQARVDHASTLVNWATATVGFGVSLEAVEPIHDLIAWIRFRKRDSAHTKELAEFIPVSRNKSKYIGSPHPSWLKWFGRVGLIVVVAGVIAEWRCGAKLEDAHNGVHEYDLAKLTEADKKAGSAKDSADAVGKEYDSLLKKYTAAEGELIELKAERMPRRLSSEQQATLRQRAATFAIKTIGIGCVNTDQEGFDFEQDFVRTFGNAGSPVKLDFWLTSCDTQIGPAGPDSFHPPIDIWTGSGRQGDAEILRKALIKIGIDKKQIRIKPNDNQTMLRLMVGPHAQWAPEDAKRPR